MGLTLQRPVPLSHQRECGGSNPALLPKGGNLLRGKAACAGHRASLQRHNMFHSSHRCIEGRHHADRDDDLNAVVALATGTLPQDAGQIYELLSTAPGQGQSLNSTFAVAMGQPDVAKDGFFYDSSRGYDEDAMSFAKRTVELANQLAQRVP